MGQEYNIESARLAYGEQIIRCTNPPPEQVEDFLSLDGELGKARQWLAFAHAKREGNADAIRGLLVYLCSHGAETVDRPKRAWLLEQIEDKRIRMEQLTLEMISGTRLNWSHVFALVGKEFNPTREKERVAQIFEGLMAQDAGERGEQT